MKTDITRWDPFLELMNMRDWMTRDPAQYGEMRSSAMAMNVYEDDGRIVVETSLPGVKRDDIEITLSSGRLTIKGQRQDKTEKADGDYLLKELRHGSFSRTLRVPTDLDAEKAKASLVDGVLRLTIPHKQGASPRTIHIK